MICFSGLFTLGTFLSKALTIRDYQNRKQVVPINFAYGSDSVLTIIANWNRSLILEAAPQVAFLAFEYLTQLKMAKFSRNVS